MHYVAPFPHLKLKCVRNVRGMFIHNTNLDSAQTPRNILLLINREYMLLDMCYKSKQIINKNFEKPNLFPCSISLTERSGKQ